ncbi:MAG: hypothetical protein J7K81_09985 [Methanophagales archaeon]|nr:hypothetical protein [Methanophagales archaeon]
MLDWKQPYQPATVTNKQLADDWRLFIAAIANLDAGKDEPYIYEDIYKWAAACLREIIERGSSPNSPFQLLRYSFPLLST